MKIIGHRGAVNLAPENSLSSCYALKYINKNWIEIDVLLSKDNVPVIFHDKKLDRCTDLKGDLRKYTLNELKKTNNGLYFSKKFKNEKIPTLTEFILLCEKLSINIFLELKSYYSNNYEEKLVNEVVKRLKKYHLNKNEIILCSYSRNIIKLLKKKLPNYKRSLIVDYIPNDWIKFIFKYKCYSINIAYNKNINIINSFKNSVIKIPIYCYCINNIDDYKKLKKIKINGIITDNPEIF